MAQILAIDLGGTAVKAGLFKRGLLKRTGLWEHQYRVLPLERAVDHLVQCIVDFSAEAKIASIGLGVAGLVASDGSLYRSTVLTSFTGYDLPALLRKRFGCPVTIDNDADCGAIGEQHLTATEPLFCVVVGSGIGSALIEPDRTLPYKVKLASGHQFSDRDNPIPNDLGLMVPLPYGLIYGQLARSTEDHEIIDRHLVDSVGCKLTGPGGDPGSVRVGVLGSALGVKLIAEILLDLAEASPLEYYRQYHGIDISESWRSSQATQMLGCFASRGDPIADQAFQHFGYFLGYGITEAVRFIVQDRGYVPEVHLGGAVMSSYACFKATLQDALGEMGVVSRVVPARRPGLLNLVGAYIQAKRALEGE